MSATTVSPVNEPAQISEPGIVHAKGPWQLFVMRLRRDRPTMVMLGIVILALVTAIIAPILSVLGILDSNASYPDLIDMNGLPTGPLGGISLTHPLGIEPLTGRDVATRVVLGVTTSLSIALLAALVSVLIGAAVGIIAGYSRGFVDFWLSRLIELTLSFPQTLMLLALSGTVTAVLINTFKVPAGPIANGLYVVLILGLFGWPNFARIIRGQVLSLREREFVEAAKSLGASKWRIYTKELFPNLWAPVLVYLTLLMPTYISAEAALSYLGVGIKPPTPTLGNILKDSVNWSSGDPIFFFLPAIVIAILVLSFNLLGDGLRDALDPKGDR